MKIEQAIAKRIQQFALTYHRNGTTWVALSGGLDSMVLIHVLKELSSLLPGPLKAIHVNHQLSPWADSWEAHVRKTTDTLGIPLIVERVTVPDRSEEGVEASARALRYQACGKHLQKNEALFTAHHADDQVETVLHHLFRGSGVKGLAGMQTEMRRDHFRHLRPCLDIERSDLEAYAREHGLVWVEDESNDDTRFSRNFIRHRVLPLVSEAYPGVKQAILRVSRHMQVAEATLNELAESDLAGCRLEDPKTLDLNGLQQLNLARQSEVLRRWFSENRVVLPSEKKMMSLLSSVVAARPDANPVESWGGVFLRRYRNKLHLIEGELPKTAAMELEWDPTEPLELPLGLGTLVFSSELRHPDSFKVRFRSQGEKIILDEAVGPQSLKKILQNLSIPPWKRLLVPLVYSSSDELLAVAGISESHSFKERFGECGAIEWRHSLYFEPV